MKRKANHFDWGTPQTKRSFASESVISTPQDPFHEYITSNYNGISSYKLGQINSILIKNNKIYNLLQNALPKRSFRCNCVKSFCQAKYCQCFRNGQICGQECNCKECNNKTLKGQTLKPQNDFFCKCVKSSCLKKYCECYQNGQRCGDKCQCLDCKNFSKQDLF